MGSKDSVSPKVPPPNDFERLTSTVGLSTAQRSRARAMSSKSIELLGIGLPCHYRRTALIDRTLRATSSESWSVIYRTA
jgi:hypothetical protein